MRGAHVARRVEDLVEAAGDVAGLVVGEPELEPVQKRVPGLLGPPGR
jgi:uncharacterized protein with PhoU and TrkA domain